MPRESTTPALAQVGTPQGDAWATLRPWLTALSVAAGISALWLSTAGCAAVGVGGSEERHAVIARIVAASARVTVERGGRRVGTGSGVVIASQAEGPGAGAISYVLTAAHILDAKEEGLVFVRFAGEYAGRGRFAATVVRQGNTDRLDLALLRVGGIVVPPIPLAADEQVRLWEEVLVVGFPWGRRLGLFGGIVSQVPLDGAEGRAAEQGGDQTLTVDAAVSNGVSGGGVFHAATGSLLGVVEGYQTASIAVKGRTQTYSVRVPMPGETYVVSVGRIRQFLDRFPSEGTPEPPGRSPTGRD